MKIRRLNSLSGLIGTQSKYGNIIDIKEFTSSTDAIGFVEKLSPSDIDSYAYSTSADREKSKNDLINKINKYKGKIVLVKEEIDDEDDTYSTWRVMTEKM